MRAGLLLAAVVAAVPTMASTPVGSLRSKPQHTAYTSAAACRDALNRWVDERLAHEDANPTVPPNVFVLRGPISLDDRGTGFTITRTVNVDDGPVRMSTSYYYEHSCKDRTYIAVSDGYQSSPMPAPPPLPSQAEQRAGS